MNFSLEQKRKEILDFFFCNFSTSSTFGSLINSFVLCSIKSRFSILFIIMFD
jgi:hypothetical protein